MYWRVIRMRGRVQDSLVCASAGASTGIGVSRREYRW